jgi:hypothetical protein
VVVEAEVKDEQGRTLFGVNREVRSKKDLTGPTLLEMPVSHTGLGLLLGGRSVTPSKPSPRALPALFATAPP